jgi:hypothetical protein
MRLRSTGAQRTHAAIIWRTCRCTAVRYRARYRTFGVVLPFATAPPFLEPRSGAHFELIRRVRDVGVEII